MTAGPDCVNDGRYRLALTGHGDGRGGIDHRQFQPAAGGRDQRARVLFTDAQRRHRIATRQAAHHVGAGRHHGHSIRQGDTSCEIGRRYFAEAMTDC